MRNKQATCPYTYMRRPLIAVALCAALLLPAGASAPIAAAARVKRAAAHDGLASFYGRSFHGRRTASGIPLDTHALVAAHPSYPFGTRVQVTNLKNGRSVVVRV